MWVGTFCRLIRIKLFYIQTAQGGLALKKTSNTNKSVGITFLYLYSLYDLVVYSSKM